ncbi:hypothetical protein CEXT_261891 [Caerostris extrusa]|uniref:Uncharacterized protein n=1 Tax=Caerostris extrusa TaxID=172846 RepID=A0AAV4T228_CAEEX|nr:hypothetical protein CEXT_261891 [Caerostris extrusa]
MASPPKQQRFVINGMKSGFAIKIFALRIREHCLLFCPLLLQVFKVTHKLNEEVEQVKEMATFKINGRVMSSFDNKWEDVRCIVGGCKWHEEMDGPLPIDLSLSCFIRTRRELNSAGIVSGKRKG